MEFKKIIALFLYLSCLSELTMIHAEDPYLFFEWQVTYGTLSPLGTTSQPVILINGQFPGPLINSTSNNNIVLNVFNKLDEPLLFHFNGIQQRKNSWIDGLPGTNCPIQPGTNFTYHFQVKDQIGSYFYYPSTALHKAAGGYGPLRIHSRDLIPVPFDIPADDITVMIGDWYSKSHTALKEILDSGRTLPRPDGILINGKGGLGHEKPNEPPMFVMKPGKTYRYRFCNVGMRNSINVRFQGHPMKLVEIEGSHTVQNMYDSLDIHLGQCFSVLVTANQDPKNYVFVASTRFTKTVLTSTAIVGYEGGKGAASPELPPSPEGIAWSLNQFRSFRWNLTASAARPNPQGSYHYGKINITRTIRLSANSGHVDGKLRYGFNGVSHTDTETPLKLAEFFGVADKVFKYDTIQDIPPAENNENIIIAPNVLNATFRNFVEIILENDDHNMNTFHLSGYSFFAVAMESGEWSPEKRKGYNLVDAVSRHTIHVHPKSWAAIMLTLDNAGMWNLRSSVLEREYLGQQLYISVLSPERSLRDEYYLPETTMLCGIVPGLPKPPAYGLA